MTRAAWIGAAVIGVLALAHVAHYFGPFEDAYITFRYAQNLLAGHGFAFNPGERVEGFTSLGWLLLLTAASAAGASLELIASVLSVAFGVLLVALTVPLARRYRSTSVEAFTAAACVAANGTWAYYSGTGMETTLFACLLAAAMLIAATPGPRAAVAAGAVLAAATLVRPEGVGYAALLASALLVSAGARRDALWLAASFTLLFVPQLLWRLDYFGQPLPNTYYAKASPSLRLFMAGLLHLERYATPHLTWLAVPAALHWVWRSQRARVACISLAVVLGAMLNEIVVGGDTFPFHRFMLPAAPLTAVVMLRGLRVLLSAKLDPSRLERALALGGAVLVLWTALLGVLPRFSFAGVAGRSMSEIRRDIQGLNERYFVVGAWLGRRFPPGTTVALNAAGIVPYVSGLPVIDMLGLNDAHIAHAPIELGRGMHGHEKHDAAYVLSRRPELVILGLPLPTSRPLTTEQALERFRNWSKHLPGDAALLESAAFHEAYGANNYRIPGVGYLLIFTRRDAAAALSSTQQRLHEHGTGGERGQREHGAAGVPSVEP